MLSVFVALCWVSFKDKQRAHAEKNAFRNDAQVPSSLASLSRLWLYRCLTFVAVAVHPPAIKRSTFAQRIVIEDPSVPTAKVTGFSEAIVFTFEPVQTRFKSAFA